MGSSDDAIRRLFDLFTQRNRDGHGQAIRLIGIEGDCTDIARLHRSGECGHIDDLNELNGSGEDPFELTCRAMSAEGSDDRQPKMTLSDRRSGSRQGSGWPIRQDRGGQHNGPL
jgi:hypothetical protein